MSWFGQYLFVIAWISAHTWPRTCCCRRGNAKSGARLISYISVPSKMLQHSRFWQNKSPLERRGLTSLSEMTWHWCITSCAISRIRNLLPLSRPVFGIRRLDQPQTIIISPTICTIICSSQLSHPKGSIVMYVHNRNLKFPLDKFALLPLWKMLEQELTMRNILTWLLLEPWLK